MSHRTAKPQSALRSVQASLSLLISMALMPAAVCAQNALPVPLTYDAEYEARAMGMTTTAYRHLERTEAGQFSLNHGLSVSVLGANLITVEETSVFTWQDNGAQPLDYRYRQTGIRRRDERVVFNWDSADPAASTATMTREDREQQQSLQVNTLDNLSFSAQLSADLLNNPHLRTPETVLSYPILDARRLETHEYRVLGAERIQTPAGELDTIKLERIRDADSERSTLIWLSENHQYNLARLSQTEGGGSAMELTLTGITWTNTEPAR